MNRDQGLQDLAPKPPHGKFASPMLAEHHEKECARLRAARNPSVSQPDKKPTTVKRQIRRA
ncbi:MAG: hypothetical protein WCI89_03140 [bacterium]